jgi:hypothetical protein
MHYHALRLEVDHSELWTIVLSAMGDLPMKREHQELKLRKDRSFEGSARDIWAIIILFVAFMIGRKVKQEKK